MTVIVLERVTPSLRGLLTRWMMEVRAGVFVGRLSPRVRALLWEKVAGYAGAQAGCLLLYATPSEQGFAMESFGDPSREIVDFDGLQLLRRPAPTDGKVSAPRSRRTLTK